MSAPSDAPLMLGVSGLRGIVGQSLTPEVAVRFSTAFGTWLQTGTGAPWDPVVIISRDGRLAGEMIARAAIAGLQSVGCQVIDLGIATTPTTGVMVDHIESACAGLIVTASHNPQEWNGLKCLVGRKQVGDPDDWIHACAQSAAQAAEIVSAFQRGEASRRTQYTAWTPSERPDAAEVHVRSVRTAVMDVCEAPPGEVWPFRCVVDSVNCSGATVAAPLLANLIERATQLHGSGSGEFPHAPEPTRENLSGAGELCDAVPGLRAHIGFAQDPDGDRLAIVDERGEYIGEEYTLALAAESLLSAPGRDAPAHRGGRVLVTNLSTSRMIDDIAAAHGARVVRTPVGEANVVEAMKREKAAGHDVVLGGEGNGGVIWPKVTYVRDSLSSMALVLALMARTGKKVSELVAAIPAYAIEKRKVELARKEDANPAVAKIAGAYRDQRVDLQDGVRVDWLDKKAWLHVRASNTEPIMRLIAESPGAAQSRAILDEAARVIAG